MLICLHINVNVLGNFLHFRSEAGSGGANSGGALAAGVSARGPEPLPCFIGQSQQSAHKWMHVTITGRVHRQRHTHAVQLSGKQSATQSGTTIYHQMNSLKHLNHSLLFLTCAACIFRTALVA